MACEGLYSYEVVFAAANGQKRRTTQNRQNVMSGCVLFIFFFFFFNFYLFVFICTMLWVFELL